MSINLLTSFGKQLALGYTHASFVKGKTSNQWNWDGAAHVVLTSIVTQDLNTYDRAAASDRYGTPVELQDTIQTIDIKQDKSFSIVIDAGNNTQQGMLKRAGEVMRAQVDEKVVPLIDKYAMGVYADNAGTSITNFTTISKSNIITALPNIEDAMSDELVPLDARFAFMPNSYVSMFREALTNCDNITDRLLLKGIVGKLGSINIIGVPASWMPEKVNILAWQKDAVVLPEQITSCVVHENPQGINGCVLEGRYLFDAAVVNAHSKGCVKVTAA